MRKKCHDARKNGESKRKEIWNWRGIGRKRKQRHISSLRKVVPLRKKKTTANSGQNWKRRNRKRNGHRKEWNPCEWGEEQLGWRKEPRDQKEKKDVRRYVPAFPAMGGN